MIKNIEKVLNVSETKLRYSKKETMTGLYFKEMLSKINSSKNKEDNSEDSKKQDVHKENEPEKDIIDDLKKEHEGEGTFLDKLC